MSLRTLLFLPLLLTACSSSDPGSDPGDARRRHPGAPAGYARTSDLEEMLPPNWWRDEELTSSLSLTGDQLARLDRIAAEQQEEVTRLQRDSSLAKRELREKLDAEQASSEDVSGAARRLRSIRDVLFERQLTMLRDERLVLTSTQWHGLQLKLRERTDDRPADRGGYRRGGGGRRGGGRRPGW